MTGDPWGSHRVLEPAGALPQPAWRLDNDFTRRFKTEIHLAVETLNIDAASFRQMDDAAEGSEAGIAELVRQTVESRGKQHNPATGSGGMLLGRVTWVGRDASHRGYAIGDRVATLASLSLTPLALERVKSVRKASAQLDVDGSAVVFLSAPMVRMPTDMPERLALAVFDVCGAAPQVQRHAGAGDRVVILGGGGKSGLLCCAEARRSVGGQGKVIGVEADARFADDLEKLGVCDAVVRLDARDPLATRSAVLKVSDDRELDLVVSCVNVQGIEPAAVLLARPRGKVYFFATTTSFTAAALGAEGMSRDIDMYIGNGYAEGHAEHSLELVRSYPTLRKLLGARYA
jgi:L-erythro-3,5-diaminohexanoate dehydrogenase